MISRTLTVCLLLSGLLFARQAGRTEQLEAAHRAEAAGDFSTAQSIYENLVSNRPDGELYQRLGLVLHLQNKYQQASQAFKRSIQLDPNAWPSQLFLGMDLYRTSSFSEALPHLQTAERLQPGRSEIQFWLGATQLALHQYMVGFGNLEAVIAKEPANADALKLLAEAYADYGTQVLDTVADRYPDSAAGLEVQGRAFEYEGSYRAALEAYQKSAAKQPARPGIGEAIARVEKEIRSNH